jgi:CRISPR-associated protein Cmr2
VLLLFDPSARETTSIVTPSPDSPAETLLLVSLGPIQDFIASARRCQDLWFGSYLLSALARSAAVAMRKAGGKDCLIFPASLDADNQPGVANKLLLRVPAGTAADVARKGKAAMEDTLRQFGDNAFEIVSQRDRGRGHFSPELRKKAEQQLADLMEFDWVSVPATGEYHEDRDLAERQLASRKNTRAWGPADRWAGYVPKSSLDGQRESVLHESLYETVPVEERRRSYFVKKAERLCGVGLLKRIGAELDDRQAEAFVALGGPVRPVFHSTSHVAAGPFRARLAASVEAQDAVHTYVQALIDAGVQIERFAIRADGKDATRSFAWQKDSPAVVARTPRRIENGPHGYDGYLFYEDRLPDIIEENQKPSSTPAGEKPEARSKRLKDLRLKPRPERDLSPAEALAAVYKLIGRPTAYYAVLLADGDSMGKAITRLGEARGADGHKEIGTQLDEFSVACKHIVEDHAGSLIYAGGDDVLALVPLHTVLDCAEALHAEFDRAMAAVKGLAEALKSGAEAAPMPTLSVGLGIAHHMDDMAHARRLAKSAETLAKSYPGKNALGIVIDKRSGSTIELCGSWKAEKEVDSDAPGATLRGRLDLWARLLHDQGISDKAAHDLQQAVAPLLVKSRNDEKGGDLGDVAAALARRVLLRKRKKGSGQALESSVKDALNAQLKDKKDMIKAVGGLSSELLAAHELLRAYELAFGEPKNKPTSAAHQTTDAAQPAEGTP